ncbi:metallophosphoesterase family protein [Brevibacillus invocatus]|uniref:metallophosphoesterase family protein n=1 Tax=Brevibacillus invocatus TaxID=173959 RepID=UPI0020406CB6|nr:metallophosphoesterase family protein [Brevibacillus invocatus]MCM3078482.1 metallophosphatase family protein [Brevibacillus invocatus]MCM3430940.1 metallophosphatase family protein [Brevibacillus invocatus]
MYESSNRGSHSCHFGCVWEDILFCHATPFTDDASLIEKVTADGVVDKPIEVLSAELQAIPQKVIVCGHTHVPKNVFLPDGKWIVNPGSVGFPAYYEESPHPHVMESHSPHAKYAILQRVEEGWSLAHVCIPYD